MDGVRNQGGRAPRHRDEGEPGEGGQDGSPDRLEIPHSGNAVVLGQRDEKGLDTAAPDERNEPAVGSGREGAPTEDQGDHERDGQEQQGFVSGRT